MMGTLPAWPPCCPTCVIPLLCSSILAMVMTPAAASSSPPNLCHNNSTGNPLLVPLGDLVGCFDEPIAPPNEEPLFLAHRTKHVNNLTAAAEFDDDDDEEGGGGGMSNAADVPAGLAENLLIAVPLGIALYGLSFLTFLGNALVLHAIRTDKRLQTVSNMFILSLASADLTVGIIVMPISAAYAITGEWKFGLYVCQLWLSMDYSASTASILNLFILSLDRYWSITTPLKYLRKRTKRRAGLMIGIVWLISLTWLVPILSWHIFFFGGIRLQVTPEHPLCETEFANNVPFKVSTAILNFYIPSAAMLYLYGRMFYAIEQRTKLEVDSRDSPKNRSSLTFQNNHNNVDGFGHQDGLRRNFAMSNRSFRSPMAPNVNNRSFRWSSTRRRPDGVDMVVNRDGNVALKEMQQQGNSLIRNNGENNGRVDDHDDAGSTSPDSFSAATGRDVDGAAAVRNRTVDVANTTNKKQKKSSKKGNSTPAQSLSMVKESSSNNAEKTSSPLAATVTNRSTLFCFVRSNNCHQNSTTQEDDIAVDGIVVRVEQTHDDHELVSGDDYPHFVDSGDDNDELAARQRLKPPTDHSNHLQCYSSRYPSRKAMSMRVPPSAASQPPGERSRRYRCSGSVRSANCDDKMSASASSPLLSPSIVRHDATSGITLSGSLTTSTATLSTISKPGSSTPRVTTLVANNNNRSGMSGGGYRHQQGDHGGGGGRLIRERKAAKQLGVIMSAFMVCWLPYFITFMVIAYCPDCISPQVHQVTIWLGYLNSTLNPFLYPMCNANFKRAFKRILGIRENP